MRKSAILTLVVLIIGATATSSFAETKLEHKVNEGDKYTTQTISTVDQTLTIVGMETKMKAENIATVEAVVGKRDGEGKISVKEKLKSMQINIKGTAGDYGFDSVNPDEAGASPLEVMRPIHKVLATRTVTTTFDKDNRVAEIKADADALAQLPEEVRALAKGQFDPDNLKEAANKLRDVLPKKAVKQGDSWERTNEADFGGGQMMEFKTKYTYEGTVESGGRTLHKITSETLTAELSINADSPLPISLKESKLTVKESKGLILFDNKKGRTVENTESVHIVGKLTFAANGQDLPAELDLKVNSEAKLQQ